jgi:hypothetical protein
MRMITADQAMIPLYQAAQGAYVTRPYATTSRQFEPDPVLAPQAREFKLDPLLVPPPGFDPGSPDFQSGAMTTSAKEAIFGTRCRD